MKSVLETPIDVEDTRVRTSSGLADSEKFASLVAFLSLRVCFAHSATLLFHNKERPVGNGQLAQFIYSPSQQDLSSLSPQSFL